MSKHGEIIKSMLEMMCFSMLLGISSVYGFMGMTAEMGLAILAGSIGLAFSNIDKIARFKGAGFEAEMCKKIMHIPTGVVHKVTKGGVTACGIDTKNNPECWIPSSEEVTCSSDGCKNNE
ncbi:hypothetical protein [Alloalcanivorax xenomutans]|uniref:hypothetical protein n=1 Tax=Alloalcanivorax xenomutans TaxID=1094342 RepID=UPI0024E1A2D0|nr:hypothetical protein [Alloalcanivorax xenomutans]